MLPSVSSLMQTVAQQLKMMCLCSFSFSAKYQQYHRLMYCTVLYCHGLSPWLGPWVGLLYHGSWWCWYWTKGIAVACSPYVWNMQLICHSSLVMHHNICQCFIINRSCSVSPVLHLEKASLSYVPSTRQIIQDYIRFVFAMFLKTCYFYNVFCLPRVCETSRDKKKCF